MVDLISCLIGGLYFLSDNVKRVGIEVLFLNTTIVDCWVNIGMLLNEIEGGSHGLVEVREGIGIGEMEGLTAAD